MRWLQRSVTHSLGQQSLVGQESRLVDLWVVVSILDRGSKAAQHTHTHTLTHTCTHSQHYCTCRHNICGAYASPQYMHNTCACTHVHIHTCIYSMHNGWNTIHTNHTCTCTFNSHIPLLGRNCTCGQNASYFTGKVPPNSPICLP